MCTVGSPLSPVMPDQICTPRSSQFLLFFDQIRFLWFVFCNAIQDREMVFFSVHCGQTSSLFLVTTATPSFGLLLRSWRLTSGTLTNRGPTSQSSFYDPLYQRTQIV
ncbi:hypothetical protein AAC387_Pa09g1944 [Persea americana]